MNGLTKELKDQINVAHCDRDLQIKERRVIWFRCESCGYKKRIIAIKEWHYEN